MKTSLYLMYCLYCLYKNALIYFLYLMLFFEKNIKKQSLGIGAFYCLIRFIVL